LHAKQGVVLEVVFNTKASDKQQISLVEKDVLVCSANNFTC